MTGQPCAAASPQQGGSGARIPSPEGTSPVRQTLQHPQTLRAVMADFGGKLGGSDGIARALGQQAGEFEESLSDFISFKYYFKEEFLFCCL